MSRSFKKNPIYGYCGGSDKSSKQCANRKLRKRNKQILKNIHLNNRCFYKIREVSNVWDFQKDGKGYYNPKMRRYNISKFLNIIERKTIIEQYFDNVMLFHRLIRK